MSKNKPNVTYNTLCQRCANSCKQHVHVKLIKCPRFEAAPMQMELPFFKKPRAKTKSI